MEAIIDVSKAYGEIMTPPSKSLAHRYIICAALSKGTSVISNIDYSEDILATIDCAIELGAKIERDGSILKVTGIDGNVNKESFSFYCRESGSTMRFFMGIALAIGIPSRFYGSETLRKRPFEIFEDICASEGIEFSKKEDYICINGRIKSNNFKVKGNISSQFITALLFVLPLLDGGEIELIPPVESRSYIYLTLQALKAFKVSAFFEDGNTLKVLPGEYVASNITVEGDESNAAFLEAFNCLGGDVKVLGLNKDTLQGDRVYKNYFEALKQENAVLDITDCPDLGPVLFAVAAALNGGTLTGTKRLKLKESDRGRVMCEELSKFGVRSESTENSVTIYKSELKKPTEIIRGHNDHRIVMSLTLLLTLTGGIINEAEAVRKSYPNFFNDIKKLGIGVKFNGMDK